MVLANHKRTGDELSAQFGRSVQDLADGLGDDPSDEALLQAAVSVTYPGRDPNEIPAFDERNDPLLSWLMLEKGRFGGVLGSQLTFGFVPIFSPREIIAFDEQLEDLRERPPVFVWKPFINKGLAARTFRASGWPITRDKMPADVGAAFDVLTTAFDKVLGEPMSVGVEGPAVRAAYRTFARLFHPWAISDDRAAEEITTSPNLLSFALPKQTFHPLHRIEQAYSDIAGFEPTRDGRGLVHRVETKERKKDPIEVILAPLEDPRWFPPATVDDLQNKLLTIGTSASFTFAVAISLAVEHEFVDLELDDFIKLLGLDPRSVEQRNEQRRLLWESLKLFAQTSAVGELHGTYRDTNGNPIKRIEESPIIAITGKQYPAEMRLDRSETPIAVSFVPGNFLRRNRSNRKLLASLGDLRVLAAIPSGKAAGRWARTIGLALLQYWREGAAGAEIKRVGEDSHPTFRPELITRRRLFERMRPDPDPFELLKSSNPARAREYWDDAIELLRQQKSVQLVAKAKPNRPRKGWQDAWLDEALDLRPHRENVVAIAGVTSVSDGAKAWRKKRGTRRKKSG